MDAFDWTGEIRRAFEEEVAGQGGRVRELIHAGEELFGRSTNPEALDAAPGDRLFSGVAIRWCGDCLSVRPYVFRKVCSNGTIMARALEARVIEYVTAGDPEERLDGFRAAVRACGSKHAFEGARDRMAASRDRAADFEVNFVAHAATHGAEWAHLGQLLLRLRAAMAMRSLGREQRRRFAVMELAGVDPGAIVRILERFADGEDVTRYGLLNAVTSVARDDPDPRLKWDLETLGGELAWLPVGPATPRPRRRSAMAMGLTRRPGRLSKLARSGR